MRAALAFMLIAVLLFGCVSQQSGAKITEAAPEPIVHDIPVQPASNGTINTSTDFVRNVSDVMNTDTVFPEMPNFDFSPKTEPDGRPIVYFFYSPYCSACKAIIPEIDALETRHTEVSWKRYDITSVNGSIAYKNFSAQYGLNSSQMMVPQVLVNGTIITDRFNINKSLEGIIISFGGTE